MTLQDLQSQVLQLPIGDRWYLVQLLLSSIQQESLVLSSQSSTVNSLTKLDPWTQSLIGVIRLETEEPQEIYVNYLEEKYS